MATDPSTPAKTQRYRLPGIEREGIAQLSLLETALWPLQGGTLQGAHQFQTEYAYSTAAGRRSATVTVRAALGLQPFDEFVLWGLLGATLSRRTVEPVLLATPYWMLKHLGLATGGSQYSELRESLLRLAVASYQNTAFYNPDRGEHEYTAFQFLSMLLPTVGGIGETVDTDRLWRIEWNPAFFRFCRASGGSLLFDLDVFRSLSPAARRLFLKLKDRFWRSKRVFMNVDELTIQGLGFSAARPLFKRKFDLLQCMRELLAAEVIALDRGQTDPKELILKRSKGSYIVSFFEGEYFRKAIARRILDPLDELRDDPLYEPLSKIGVESGSLRRLLRKHSYGLIQRWVRITDAAMHENPQGFPGFRVSPAAFFLDGVEHKRTPPDWMHAHEKRQQQRQWTEQGSTSVEEHRERRERYDTERNAAFTAFLASSEARQQYEQTFALFLPLFRVKEPERAEEAAREATLARLERLDFHFHDYDVWCQVHASNKPTNSEGDAR